MAINAGVGQSKQKDSYQAGYEACQKAIEMAGGKDPALTIVFSSVSFDQEEMLQGVREASNGAPLVGCSDAGEITNEGPMQNAVGVMAITSDQLSFYTGLGKDVKNGDRQAGQAVAKEVKKKAKDELKSFVMFPDVLTGNGAEIVRGVTDVLGSHFPVVGGAAGDDFLFQKTYEYCEGTVATGAVAGVGLGGKFTMGMGVRHGWMPVGVPMKVTKSKGSVIYELDHRPAVSIYEDYFGSKAEELRKEPLARMAITYPLGLKLHDMDEYLIRDPITVDENGALTCAAEIPEGAELRLMIGSREKAIDAAREAAQKVMADFRAAGSHPKFVLMFNCIAREKLFGDKAQEEIQAMMEIIGKDVPLLGFYTYGEQAPLRGEVRNLEKCDTRFYNETVVLFAVGE